MRTAIAGAVLLVLGGVAIAVGVLRPAAALAVAGRVWPILLFVVAMTVVAELAAEAGLFRAVAARLQRLGRGRALVLWLLVLALAVGCTVFLSLDTTAVLITPVVVLVATEAGLPSRAFALTTVWIANAGSLLLPVSNLTNLLAQGALAGADVGRFVALTAAPAVAAIVVPAVLIAVAFRRDLALRFTAPPTPRIEDPVLFRIAAGVVIVLLPLLVSGLPVWMPTLGAAIALAVATGVRRRVLGRAVFGATGVLRWGLLPWQLVLFVAGLFLVVDAAYGLGLGALTSWAAGAGDTPPALLRVAGVSAAGANLVDNLPAYLAFEPVAGSRPRLLALLIGVNAGPLITPWASLATLLWHARTRALGAAIPWGQYVGLGATVAPLTVAAATLAFAL